MLAPHLLETRFDVLDKIPVGILVLDPDYQIVFWNECLENWTGIQRSELVGADARSRFPDIGKSSFSRRIERVFRDGVPTVFSPQLHAPVDPMRDHPGNLSCPVHHHDFHSEAKRAGILSGLVDSRHYGFDAASG